MRLTSRPLTTALVTALLLGACATAETAAPDDPQPDSPAPTTPSDEPAVTETATPTGEPSPDVSPAAELASDCAGSLGPAPGEGSPTITAVTADGLIEVDPETGDVRCLIAGPLPVGPLRWNPTAENLLVGDQVVGGPRLPVTSTASWSRPTGTAVIDAVEGRLRKVDATTGDRADVSFLDGHAAVTYYPSGTHLVTVGGSQGAANEIWFSTNTGGEPRLLTEAEAGVVLSSPRVSDDGSVLTFVADHGDEVHVHRAFLQGEGVAGGPEEQSAQTVLTLDAVPEVTLVSDFGWSVVTSAGCGAPVQASDESLSTFLSGRDDVLTPVALLNDSALVAIEHGDGCDAPGTLVVLDGVAETRTPLLGAVTSATVRAPVTGAPPPPTEGFSGFA